MNPPPPVVDINADLGEGFGAWRMGDDDAMLRIATSANVACGFHAGDPDIMAKTFARSRELGVAVGAHVGYPDLSGFGRRAMSLTPKEIENAVAYQLGAAMALARAVGSRIAYVKAHGALANRAETDAEAAEAIARATRAVDPSLALLAIALSEQTHAGERFGLRVAHEIFADRAYAEDGRLVSRREPGAVIDDIDAAINRVKAMLAEGALITISGKRLKTPIDSVCVHGDAPHAVEMAAALRAALTQAGYAVRAFASLGHAV